MSASIEIAVSSHSLPDQIVYESENPFVSGKVKANGVAQNYFSTLGIYLRDRFYLPMRKGPIESFFQQSNIHAENVTKMLKGENQDFDPTFPHLPELSKHYDTRDIPIMIKSGENSLVSTVRIIESKKETNGHKLRLVLFSYYENQQMSGAELSPWNPKTADELSAAPLEVLKALQTHTKVDSMMCFSLGAMALDGLKHLALKDADLIPKTLILNRPLASIWKVASVLFPWMKWGLYSLASLYGLNADPEREVVSFHQRVRQPDRRVVAFSVTRDRYFSGAGALDPNFHSQIADANTRVDHGKFFVPLLAEVAQHGHRLDHVINNEGSETDTTNFLNMRPNESVPQALNREVFRTGDDHTCLIVGGNKDNLDSITYLQALPIIEAHYKDTKGTN